MLNISKDDLFNSMRLFAEARKVALQSGFTDNAGAIHSIERILEILCRKIVFPSVAHPNGLKRHERVEISIAAHAEREAGNLGAIQIEHVMPQRAFAREVLSRLERFSDSEIEDYISTTYRIVILTKKERRQCDRLNRTRMTPDRIAEAGIELFKRRQ